MDYTLKTPPWSADDTRSDELPGAFFTEKDANDEMGISSAQDLWDWISAGASRPLSGHGAAMPSGDGVFYRGQHDASYSLTSSLYRLCRSEVDGQVTEHHLERAEQAILNAMKAEGMGRLMTDGELLMVLQHHLVPTRLVDVSTGAMEALFFAVDSQDSVPGRLFIIETHNPGDVLSLSGEAGAPLPWAGSAIGRVRSAGDWTDRLATVDEQPLDPRMRAQRGKFLVGGLNRSWGGKSMYVGGSKVPASLYPEVTSLNINFLRRRGQVRNGSWQATGWTLRIEASWKRDLRVLLNEVTPSIRQDTMYPPIDEVRRLAVSVARNDLSH